MDPESFCKPDQSVDSPVKHPKKYQKISVAKRSAVQHGPDSEEEPELSCVSLKSSRSTDRYIDLKGERKTSERFYRGSAPVQPQHEPSCASYRSTDRYIDLKGQKSSFTSPVLNQAKPGPSCVSQMSNQATDSYVDFNKEPSSAESSSHQSSEVSSVQHETPLDFIFQRVEEKMEASMKNVLKKIKKILSTDAEDEDVLLSVDKNQQKKADTFVNITVDLLREIGQEELADRLQKKTLAAACQRKLRLALKLKYQLLYEGIPKAGKPSHLNQIYTELYITEGETGEANDQHEVRQVETACRKPDKPETTIRHEEIFKPLHGKGEPIRTVMTQGVAGIGKKVLTRKVILDWAEDRANQNVQFMFPFTFRELNVLKEKRFSLVGLIHHFFTETKEICNFEEFDVVVILNGLDECRLHLDFHKTETLTDPRKSSSVNVLLTNLIRGNLLPSARLWITTRPAAASQIPPECVDMVTEIRGFSDPQKEEYFRKRFSNEEQANKIISHIKMSQSLITMYQIPVFCWISATVLEDVLKTREGGELPKTLTEMYIHFLVVQTKLKKVKYEEGAETDPHWSPESRKMIESLGKLAFEQLQKGNLIFYESDLTECGIDVRAASVYSGVFTQIFKEERGLYQDKVFCFIHLSVQEFLAALYVHLTFISLGVNLLIEECTRSTEVKTRDSTQFYQSAVDKALQSPNGHLDLFLRFLLGLSLKANQTLLRDLQTGGHSETNQETIKYIKEKINGSQSTERTINLFHCLQELNDSSLVEEIQMSLGAGTLFKKKLSPGQWSALVFVLLSSDKDLDVFDLRKYSATEEAFLRLLPVVKASNKTLVGGFNLSEKSCEALSSVLMSSSCRLRELDLSNNDLKDSGVELLCVALKDPRCKLETLRLSGCLITERGCDSLASALRLNPSHLKELDLSYNHPGEAGVRSLTAGLKDPNWSLETLRVEPSGVQYLKPGLKKFDINTVNRNLKLSDNNKKIMSVEIVQSYPDHPDRFDVNPQLLCGNGVTGRSYWEVEWGGRVEVSVSYRGIKRKQESLGCMFGADDQSWSLSCSKHPYYVWHNNRSELCSSSSASNRVAVYVDCPAGVLSFYSVSSDTLTHLHTFNTTFTQTLHPGFMLKPGSFICLG